MGVFIIEQVNTYKIAAKNEGAALDAVYSGDLMPDEQDHTVVWKDNEDA